MGTWTNGHLPTTTLVGSPPESIGSEDLPAVSEPTSRRVHGSHLESSLGATAHLPARGTILCVCTANVTRSVFMQFVLRWLLAREGLTDIRVESAGIKAIAGAGPHPQVSAWLDRRAMPHGDFHARRLEADDIASADLVITATRRQRDLVVRMVPSSNSKTFTALQLSRLLGGTPSSADTLTHPAAVSTPAVLAQVAASRRGLTRSAGGADDVEDPTGHRASVFVAAFALLQPALAAIVRHLAALNQESTSQGKKGTTKE